MIKHEERQIFVTGVYGSGKTTYAKAYAEQFGFKYIDFDMYFNYASTLSVLKNQSDEHFLNILSNDFITDAIPWDPKTESTQRFKNYALKQNALVVCCICPDKDEWIKRLVEVKKLEMTNDRFSHYKVYYEKILPVYFDLNLKIYDTTKDEFITKEEMYSRISWLSEYN